MTLSLERPVNDHNFVVTFSDLCDLCALDQVADVVTWLGVNDVAFFLNADDRPCTTASALNEAVHRGKILAQPSLITMSYQR